MSTSNDTIENPTSDLTWIRFVWRSVLVVTAMASIFVFISSAVPYLLLQESALRRFDGRRGWIVVHVATASFVLLSGPFQLWLGHSRKMPLLHRRLGFAYIATISVSSVAAFYLAIHIDGPFWEGAGLFGAGCIWVITTSMGIVSLRRREFLLHQQWMIRNYIATLSFVAFRIMILIGKELKLGSWDDRLIFASWASWVVPLLIAEFLLRKQRTAALPTAPN
ncbi:MAG: DUF2306 domain-containing protein [Planctomycetota bacterium]